VISLGKMKISHGRAEKELEKSWKNLRFGAILRRKMQKSFGFSTKNDFNETQSYTQPGNRTLGST